MNNEEFLRLMAKYKFTIAFENAVGDDYITEKLWRPLTLGSVPIYLGSPSVQVIHLCTNSISLQNSMFGLTVLGLGAS